MQQQALLCQRESIMLQWPLWSLIITSGVKSHTLYSSPRTKNTDCIYISYYNRSRTHHGQCLHLYEIEGFWDWIWFRPAEPVYTKCALQQLYCRAIFWDTIHWSYALKLFYTNNFHLFVQTHGEQSLCFKKCCSCTHAHVLTHKAVGACSFTVESGFTAYDLMVVLLATIASFSILWCSLVK